MPSTRLSRRILIVLTVVCGWFWFYFPAALADDDHYKKREGREKRYQTHYGHKDEGNEPTGQAAAWVFGAANLTVGISFLTRQAIRRFRHNDRLAEGLKRFNRLQKRYLLPIHYLLNPAAVLLAITHFSLSACRSSVLPEWGLALMAVIAAIGVLIKFRIPPQRLRKFVYKLHTSPLPLLLLIAVLLVGHQIVD